jgi:Na+/proline symporter
MALGKLPLYKNFFANTFIKAFILNAIAVAIISALSIEIRSYLDTLGRDVKGGWKLTDLTKTLIVFSSAFLVAILVYLILYLVVGFGGGMITTHKKIKSLTRELRIG